MPAVLILPVLKVMLRPAVPVIAPDTADTLAFTRISLAVPAAVARLIVLLVPVVATVPFKRILPAPTLPFIAILPAAWTVPPLSTSTAVLEAVPATPVRSEPDSVRLPLELIEPVFCTTKPPTPVLPLSAVNVKLEPAPVEVNAPATMILRTTEKVVALVKLTVPIVRSVPLPCSVILPAPTTGDAFNDTPPPIVNTPPLPAPVFNTPLSTMEFVLLGLAAVAVIEPPLVLMPLVIVNTRVVLSGVKTLRLTLPPVVLIAPETVVAPVLVILTPPVPLLCVIPVIENGSALFVNEIVPLLPFVALKLEIILAPPSVVPPTELVVNKPLVVTRPEPVSEIVPLEVKPTLLAAPAIVPVMPMLPVLFTDSAPIPVCEIPEIVNAEPLVNDNAPPPVFVSLKPDIRFAPLKVSPPTETLVSVPVVLIKPEPLSTIVPLEVKPILLAAPAIVPVTPILPVLFTDSAPVPVCEMPEIVSAAPLVNDSVPPPVFVALKVETTFAPPKVSPPTETLVNVPVVLIKPEPLSEMVPLEVKPILLAAPAMVPVIPILPVLFTETVPVPVCEMPEIVSAAPLVSDNAPPLVFVALNLDTTLAPLKVSPPTETLVNVPVVLIKPAPVSTMVPLEFKPILFAPPATVPVILILPVLLTDTAPVPVCEMPVIANGAAVFTKEITPAPLFEPLKLVTVFALPKVVPVAELVVSKPPFNKPAPASLMVPAVPVSEMPPLVLTLPAFSVTLLPADALIAPDVLPTFALNKMLLEAPVAANVT